ncbi:OmpA family protein [Flavobacterium filum]|uniref:OmpA family protein n=1 Tax=Flavobacterium filum TaxID=370974 RepID=UPI0023F54C6F|nr:OmpA family protein [Flavobacterium filum]
MKKEILTIILVLTTLMSFGQSSIVYFDKDSYSLSNETKKKLDLLIKKIKKTQFINEIAIIGHTDSDASFEYNKVLSLKRARKVKEYFSSKGLQNRFHVLSKSESELMNDNKTELEKSKNRRVEIIQEYSTNNFAYEVFKRGFQEFTISPKQDTQITCKEGTLLKIDQGAFNLINETSNLTIKVQEFYKKSDFLSSNLTTTTSNNEQLESRGMIYIEVYQDNKELQIKEGKTIGIVFKDRKINDATNLFEGLEHNNEIVWNQTGTNKSYSSTESGWSMTWIGNDTIQKLRWWYETIGEETFKIEHIIEKEVERFDTLSVENEKLMKELILSSPKLGWINCDRFYDSNSPKIDLIVEFNEEFTPDVSLIFEEINSVLPYSYREDNKLIFKNVPINMKVKLVGKYKQNTNSDIYYASKECTSKANLTELLIFDLLTKDEIEKKIKML